MESGDEAVLGNRWPDALLLARGDDPFALVEAAVPEAAKYSGTAKPLREKQLPPALDYFAWCSWDAFYSSVSAQGVIEGVRSLRAGGAPPKLVIIDDGWQATDLDARFRGWQDPGSAIIATAKERFGSIGGSLDSGGEDGEQPPKEEIAREAYIEGESEMISTVLRDIPAGTATGQLLQEVKAADDIRVESVDYYTIAQQHDAAGCAPDGIAAPRQHANRRHRNVVTRASLAIFQYVAGLVVGAFQALIILFYQWVVDPAADNSWPVKLFTYLASGPLHSPMLQFYADQTNFTRRLVDIRANAKFHSPDATPESIHSGKEENLASVVSHLKEHFGVEFVYCWHGLSAYWSGVCPDSPGMRKYRPKIVYARPPTSLREIEPSMLWNPIVLAGLGAVYDPKPLFQDMHKYLSSAGVSGVKVDCQAGVGMVGSVTGGGPAVAARYHAALEDSVSEHFPENHVINCMCHSTENIYRWRDTAVARASDDFFPTDTASHLPHIAACAYNGFFISALALPDFDMFHSKHAVAGAHAAARAVSGGPVYVSDAPGHHNFDILHQLVLPNGRVLRANLPGRPTRDCLFLDVLRDGKSLLKIWNLNQHTGLVGVFNLQGSSWDRQRRRFFIHSNNIPKLTTTVRVSDVEAFDIAAAGNGNVQQEEASPAAATTRESTPSEISETVNFHSNGNGNGYESDISSGPGGAADDATTSSFSAPEDKISPSGNGTTSGGHHVRKPVRPARSGEFVAYINTTGKLQRVKSSGEVQVSVDSGHAAIVTFARICSDFGVELAPIGLKNMLNSGGAITSIEVEADRGSASLASALSESGTETENYADLLAGELTAEFEDSSVLPPLLPRFHIGVRGRGMLLALCSKEPAACFVDGYQVRFSWNEEDQRLEVDVPQVGKHVEQHVVVQFR